MIKKWLPVFLIILYFILSFTHFSLTAADSLKILIAYFFTIIMAISIHPWMEKLFKDEQNTYALSRTVSLLVFGYIVWIGQIFFQFNFTWLIFIASFFLFFKNRKQSIQILKNISSLESLAFVAFLFVLIVCSFKPELNWGEKPMDISLLSYLYREGGTISEPWFSGEPLQYYYYGYFIFAKLLKLFQIPPLSGFYVVLGIIASLFFIMSHSVFQKLGLNKKTSLLGAFFLIFTSSSQSLVNLFNFKSFDFRYFWANTRVFEDSLFAEFPLWSFVFGDLHPHVISYPFFLLMVWLTLDVVQRKDQRMIYFQLISFVGVSLTVINSWDVFFLAPLNIVLIISLYWNQVVKERDYQVVINLVFTALISVVLYIPLIKVISQAGQSGSFSFFQGNHNSLMGLLKHQGVQLISLFVLLALNTSWKKITSFDSKRLIQVILYLFPMFVLLILDLKKTGDVSFEIYFLSFSLILLALYQKEGEQKLVRPWLITLAFMYLLSEHIVMLDRINSIFKINNLTYILSTILSLTLVLSLKLNQKLKYVFLFFFSLISVVSLVNSYAIAQYKVTTKDQNGLNGKVYLDELAPGDSKLIDFINQNISGAPTVLESFGKAYDYRNGRIQWYTGLKGFLVWSGQHLAQRGVPYSALKSREALIHKIYNSNSIDEKYSLLKGFKIDYVVIGIQERRQFQSNGLNLFSNNSDRFKVIFEDKVNRTILYQVL